MAQVAILIGGQSGSASIAATQVNVTNSAATLIAARTSRRRVTVINRQLAAIFVGAPTVTTAVGTQVDPGASLTLYTTALIQAITSAASGGTEKTHVLEEFD